MDIEKLKRKAEWHIDHSEGLNETGTGQIIVEYAYEVLELLKKNEELEAELDDWNKNALSKGLASIKVKDTPPIEWYDE